MGVRRKTFIKRWDIGNMSLLQDVTESEIPKDVDMPCGIFPEGIADKAFPPDSPARGRHFYATVRLICIKINPDAFKKEME